MSLQNVIVHPVVLDLPEGRIEAQLELPVGAERLVAFAYKVLDLSSVAAEMAQRAAGRVGKSVTCAKGCGACCRQLVPLSPPEAGMVFEFVMTMPEPRRQTLTRRFDQALERLGAAGLLDDLEQLQDPRMSDARDREISRAYFSEQIPCPFLEEECCGIYPVRPSICREYLVASPPDHCRDPYVNAIQRLPLAMRMSEALTHMWAAMAKRPARLVPFILALKWTRDNPGIRSLAAKPEALVKAFELRVQSIAKGIEERGM